jgi:hypothetical protein
LYVNTQLLFRANRFFPLGFPGLKMPNPVQSAYVQRREGVSNVRQSTDLHPFRASQQGAYVRSTFYTEVFTVGSFTEKDSRKYGTFSRSLGFSPCVTSFVPQRALPIYASSKVQKRLFISPICHTYLERMLQIFVVMHGACIPQPTYTKLVVGSAQRIQLMDS